MKPGTRVRVIKYGDDFFGDEQWVGKTGVVQPPRHPASQYVAVGLDDNSLGSFSLLCLPEELEAL